MKKQCWHVGSLGSAKEDKFCKVKLRLTQRAATVLCVKAVVFIQLENVGHSNSGSYVSSSAVATARRWATTREAVL